MKESEKEKYISSSFMDQLLNVRSILIPASYTLYKSVINLLLTQIIKKNTLFFEPITRLQTF